MYTFENVFSSNYFLRSSTLFIGSDFRLVVRGFYEIEFSLIIGKSQTRLHKLPTSFVSFIVPIFDTA